MITETELEYAETRLTEARVALAELEAKQLLPTQGNGAIRAAATARVELAENALRDLLTAYQAEQADLAARPEREADNADYLDELEAAFAADEADLAELIPAAQTLLATIVDKVIAYSGRVRDSSAELTLKGLGKIDGADVATYGSVQTGSRGVGVVRLRGGTVRLPAQPGDVLAWLFARVRDNRLNRQWRPPVRLNRGYADCLSEVLNAVEPPVRADYLVPLPTPQRDQVTIPVPFASERDRKRAEKQAADAVETWQGKNPWAKAK